MEYRGNFCCMGVFALEFKIVCKSIVKSVLILQSVIKVKIQKKLLNIGMKAVSQHSAGTGTDDRLQAAGAGALDAAKGYADNAAAQALADAKADAAELYQVKGDYEAAGTAAAGTAAARNCGRAFLITCCVTLFVTGDNTVGMTKLVPCVFGRVYGGGKN